MARTRRSEPDFDLSVFVETMGWNRVIEKLGRKELIEHLDKKELIKQIGKKELIEQIGKKELVELLTIEDLLANLSPAKRRELQQGLSVEAGTSQSKGR